MNFVRVNGTWVAEYISSGSKYIQLNRLSNGYIRVEAKMEGVSDYAVIGMIETSSCALFRVEVPSGVTVRIVSASEVVESKMVDYD